MGMIQFSIMIANRGKITGWNENIFYLIWMKHYILPILAYGLSLDTG
jgi:hypothetical protein